MEGEIGVENELGQWTLTFDEEKFIRGLQKRIQFDVAVRLKFFKVWGRFPTANDHISSKILDYLADQISSDKASWPTGDVRAGQRRNATIKRYLNLALFDAKAKGSLENWLVDSAFVRDSSVDRIGTQIRMWCIDKGYFPPPKKKLERIAKASKSKYDDAEYQRICERLSEESNARILESIDGNGPAPHLAGFKKSPGQPGKFSFDEIASKLKFIIELDLPAHYIESKGQQWRADLYKRVSRQDPWEIRRMPELRKVGMCTVYFSMRQLKLTDSLIDLLIDTVHKFRRRAETKIARSISANAKRVFDKERILKDILKASLENPEKRVGDVIFKIISKKDAKQIISEQNGKQPWAVEVFDIMFNSWRTHYRNMMRTLLQTVEFHSNNTNRPPLLDALSWISVHFDTRRRLYRIQDKIPINGVIDEKYLPAVIRNDGSINKYAYELCVILALREKLRCREIWVPGSEKYRNPDEDIPEDYEENRTEYYRSLGLTENAKEFVEGIRLAMEEQLLALNSTMSRSEDLKIKWTKDKAKFWFKPLVPQVEPQNLIKIKEEIATRWPMTGLLDILKETALDTQFLKCFKSVGQYQILEQASLSQRLILALYGLGTNAGLKRTSAASTQVTYDQLLHVKRRFIDADAIRDANQIISNAILNIRDKSIWGENGSACASDSKQYPVWDQNPMAEYHARYKGWGVMIYWHVEKKSMCFFSQLKKVSSPEPASMINGVLNHCTDLDIRRQYVDSHGQTEIAFAFCNLLGFELAPRIKRIARTKLYIPENGITNVLGELGDVLTRKIDWAEIEKQYDEMVKYATAMKEGTSDPEIILRRFTRTDVMHPTYKALAELGRALKTIFVCKYLRFPEFRQEIQEGLNVMENWNSATNFVRFGRGGEISTNRLEDQEIAVQALHLLQNCVVYVNTQMYQSVLTEKPWRELLKPEDLRGITPLIYNHINPYGRFHLDLDKRIPL